MITHIKDLMTGKTNKRKRRSSRWRKVRKSFLRKNPQCYVCGSTTRLEVHHKIPFHVAPELELDISNLMTLCENKKYGINCHLLIGHCGSYRKYNKNVEQDAIYIRRTLSK